jgi:hypothetical protein
MTDSLTSDGYTQPHPYGDIPVLPTPSAPFSNFPSPVSQFLARPNLCAARSLPPRGPGTFWAVRPYHSQGL